MGGGALVQKVEVAALHVTSVSEEDEGEDGAEDVVVEHGVDPAGRVGGVLSGPEGEQDGEGGELGADDLAGESPAAAVVQLLNLVGREVALGGGNGEIGHDADCSFYFSEHGSGRGRLWLSIKAHAPDF